jgi:hypothetical protein
MLLIGYRPGHEDIYARKGLFLRQFLESYLPSEDKECHFLNDRLEPTSKDDSGVEASMLFQDTVPRKPVREEAYIKPLFSQWLRYSSKEASCSAMGCKSLEPSETTPLIPYIVIEALIEARADDAKIGKPEDLFVSFYHPIASGRATMQKYHKEALQQLKKLPNLILYLEK